MDDAVAEPLEDPEDPEGLDMREVMMAAIEAREQREAAGGGEGPAIGGALIRKGRGGGSLNTADQDGTSEEDEDGKRSLMATDGGDEVSLVWR